MLGRDAGSELEKIEVLYHRFPEVVREYLGQLREAADELDLDPEAIEEAVEESATEDGASSLDPTHSIATVLEYSLLKQGWHLEHPAVPCVLISPTGRRLDTQELADRALADPADLAELRSLAAAG